MCSNFILLLFLLSFISIFRPFFFCPLSSSFSLPPQCICQPGPSLICSCSNSRPKLRLSAQFIPQKLHKFIVHSCHQLSIPAGTFRSKSVLDQIKLLDIDSLHIESDSFHGIRRSPRLFLLQNISHIPSIPSLAFAGLFRLQHFWIRNLSIGVIRPKAFSKLRKTEYLYFHQVHIQRIESGGFGQISGLEHFFIRNRIRLDWLAEGAFRGSKMEELVVENAIVKGHPGAFNGLRAKRIRLLNCRWGGGRRRRNKTKIINRENRKTNMGEENGRGIEEMLIRNSTIWEMFSSSQIHSTFQIENSSIGYWPLIIVNAKPNSHLKIRNTRIRLWESPAIGSARATVEYSRIGTIRPSSYFPKIPSPLPSLRIVDCRLRFVASNSLAISSFELLNSIVMHWHGSPFAMANADNGIFIEHSRLGIMPGLREGEIGESKGALSRINATQFRIEQSTIEGTIGANPFWQTNVSGRFEVRNCEFTAPLPESLFTGLTAIEGIEFSGNAWPCENDQPQQCGGIEKLLLTSISLPHWHFAANRCLPPPTENVTNYSTLPIQCHSSSLQNDSSSILCRQLGNFLQDCLCISSSPPPQPIPLHLFPKIRVLLLSDCADSIVQPRFDANSSLLTISHFYAFRIGQIQIDQIPASLRYLHIRHSTLKFESIKAFSNARLVEMNILDGRLEGEVPLVDYWSRLGRIGLERTKIGKEWGKVMAMRDGGEMPLDVIDNHREPQLRKRCTQGEDCLIERNGQNGRQRWRRNIFICILLIFFIY